MKTDEFYANLDDGIRDAVKALHKAGLETTDSGDGSKWLTMPCASVPHPHIVISVSLDELDQMRSQAQQALAILGEGWRADVSYSMSFEDKSPHQGIIFLEKPTEESHEKQMMRMEMGFQANLEHENFYRDLNGDPPLRPKIKEEGS